MTDNFLVFTADIVGSRRTKDQPWQQQELNRRLQTFAQEYAEAFLCLPSLSRGDEIQGVLAEPTDFAKMIRRLRYAIRPLIIRVGLGVGTITTDFNPKDSWQMDGPAFHRARQALEEVKNLKWAVTRWVSDRQNIDGKLNILLKTVGVIQSRWTSSQWEAVSLYEKMGTYKAVAQYLGITAQNVEKRCRAARWHVVREAETELGRWVQEEYFGSH